MNQPTKHKAPIVNQTSKSRQLLAFAVRADGSVLNLDVYETIGESYWGDSISAKDVLGKLRAAKATTINVRINSGGGDLFDGIAIYNLLRSSGATINVTVDGVAASAASVIMLAGDRITIMAGAFAMIHEARSGFGVYGTATDIENSIEKLKQTAELIRKANDSMASLYSAASSRRGVNVLKETFLQLMAAETWLTGEESIILGLADAVADAPSMAASIDLTAFRKTPSELIARASTKDAQVPTAAPEDKEPNMDLKTMQAAIEAKDLELATLKAEHATLKSSHETLTIEATALKAQNSTLVIERDSALSELSAHQEKLVIAEVDALVPSVLDPAERDNFVALAKASRPLFDAMIAQRNPRTLTSQIVDSDLPPVATNSAVGADEKFNALVSSEAGV